MAKTNHKPLEAPMELVANLEKLVISHHYSAQHDDLAMLKAKMAVALAEHMLAKDYITFERTFETSNLNRILLTGSVTVYNGVAEKETNNAS